MTPYTLYVVDDEETIVIGISVALKGCYKVRAFTVPEMALAAMEADPPDLVLLDIGFPGTSGLDVLKEIKSRHADAKVIMITGFEDAQMVVKAMKWGAYDYVTKPLHMETLKVNIDNAAESIQLRKEVEGLHTRYLRENMPCFIAESNVIQDVMQLVEKVAASPRTPVLVLGETGVGKELIARAIHFRSPRFKKPFVALNCAAFPVDLVESELFGYEKGAFSGANPAGKKGLIEAAAGGTLFLDEIGDMNLEVQAKMLRVLQEGTFYKVGSVHEIHIETRIVTATNRNLEELIDSGKFRRDLYFRLAVIKIEVPSLNERRDDIVPIAKHFLVMLNKEMDRSFLGFEKKAEAALREHVWVGNVRELRNVIERAVLMGEGTRITEADLGIRSQSFCSPEKVVTCPPLPQQGIDLSVLLNWIDRNYLDKALFAAEGVESNAARMLGLKLTTFRYRKKVGGKGAVGDEPGISWEKPGNAQVVKNLKLPPIGSGLDLCALQRDVEKFYMEEALKVAAGSSGQAAELLSLKLSTFHYRRKRLQD